MRKDAVQIGLIGDFSPTVKAHIAIPTAIQRSAGELGTRAEAVWLPTESIVSTDLSQYDGIWCVPASPYRSTEGALAGIQFARENCCPFLGTCGGFQHGLIEYARNVLGITSGDHEEINPDSNEKIVTRLACSLVEAEERIQIIPGTKLESIYGSVETREGYRCRFGLNPEYRFRFESSGVRTAAVSLAGEVRGMEWPDHPFFVGVLFQPERWALRGQTNPLVTSFLKAATMRHVRTESLA